MYNSITIVGNLGRDPEIKQILRVATMPSLVLQHTGKWQERNKLNGIRLLFGMKK